MYQPKYTRKIRKRRLRWKTQFVMLVSAVVLLMGVVSGSVAYLFTAEEPLENEFTPGQVLIQVTAADEDGMRTSGSVSNTGNVGAYVRAMVVVTWQDSEGRIYPAMPVEGTDYQITWNTSDWTGSAGGIGFRDYSKAIAPGESTTDLFSGCTAAAGRTPDGHHLVVDLIAEAIQADANGQAAWGRG